MHQFCRQLLVQQVLQLHLHFQKLLRSLVELNDVLFVLLHSKHRNNPQKARMYQLKYGVELLDRNLLNANVCKDPSSQLGFHSGNRSEHRHNVTS
ncbi:Uncharacterised protein [Acinetobacter baumannii]|nr:Uncharacterised protein [Acinetobacter baumannii]